MSSQPFRFVGVKFQAAQTLQSMPRDADKNVRATGLLPLVFRIPDGTERLRASN